MDSPQQQTQQSPTHHVKMATEIPSLAAKVQGDHEELEKHETLISQTCQEECPEEIKNNFEFSVSVESKHSDYDNDDNEINETSISIENMTKPDHVVADTTEESPSSVEPATLETSEETIGNTIVPSDVVVQEMVAAQLNEVKPRSETVAQGVENPIVEQPMEEVESTHLQGSPSHAFTVDLEAEDAKMIVSKPTIIAPMLIIPNNLAAPVISQVISDGHETDKIDHDDVPPSPHDNSDEGKDQTGSAVHVEVIDRENDIQLKSVPTSALETAGKQDTDKQKDTTEKPKKHGMPSFNFKFGRSKDKDPEEQEKPDVEHGSEDRERGRSLERPIHHDDVHPGLHDNSDEGKDKTDSAVHVEVIDRENDIQLKSVPTSALETAGKQDTDEQKDTTEKPKKHRMPSFKFKFGRSKDKDPGAQKEPDVKHSSEDRERGRSLERPIHHDDVPPGLHDNIDEGKDQNGSAVHVEVIDRESDIQIKSVSTSELERAGKRDTDKQKDTTEKPKKHRMPSFNFKFGRSRDKDAGEKKKPEVKDNSGDRERGRSLGRPFRNAFDSLSRSVKRKMDKSREPPVKPIARPPRPVMGPPMHLLLAACPDSEWEQKSLQSVSGPSLSNTPELPRREILKSVRQDLMEALPNDDGIITTDGQSPVRDEAEENRVLEHVAADIVQATPSPGIGMTTTHRVPADEPSIIEVDAKRQALVNKMLPMSTDEGESDHVVSKPPRPTSKPALSPILSPSDYDPYHSDQPPSPELQDPDRRRLRIVGSMARSPQPDQVPVSPQEIRGRPHTASLDRREYAAPAQPNLVRAQTLRTDYADRIRERVKSLRVTSRGSTDGVDTMRSRPKPLTKRETYVCSDAIKWPKINLTLKRRKTVPPKQVYPTPNEPIVRRPQPNIAPMFISHTQQQRPPLPSTPDQIFPVSHGGLHSEPFHKSGSISLTASNRQLTSICATEPMEDKRVPYISREIVDSNSNDDLVGDDQTAQIREALKKTQPFLRNWSEDASNTSVTAEKRAETNDSIRKFISTCARLRAVDLQGEFAAFQYPLPTFDRSQWRLRARFPDWDNLQVLNGPDEKTEYMKLISTTHKANQLIYCVQSIDSLLTEWFEYHASGSQPTDTYVNLRRNPNPTGPIFHPTLLVATLDQLLKCDSVYESSTKNDLVHACLRLAVLLTYENCFGRRSEPTTVETTGLKPMPNLQDVLIALSTSNCLVLFRPESKKQVSEESNGEKSEEEDEFIKTLYPESTTVEGAIKSLIGKIHNLATEKLTTTAMIPSLLTAIAPPDWMAMLIARICLKSDLQ